MRTQTVRFSRTAGFTLIELMVAVVIATILVTIAVPSYTNYIRQAHRTDARTALLDFAGREERYMSTHSSYTNDPTQLGYGVAAGNPVPVGSNYYQLTVCINAVLPGCTGAGATTGNAFNITATAINSQANDTACATLSVDSSGNQTATSTNCWTN